MDIHNTDSQVARAPAHVYLLQVDSNFSPESSAFPIQLLNNTLEYGHIGHEQYLLPILSAKRNINQEQLQGQEQLQVLIGSNQKNAKAVSLVEDKSNQDPQKQYVPLSNVHPHPSITSEHVIGPVPSLERSRPSLFKPSTDNQCGNNTVKIEKHPIIDNYVHIADRNVPPRAVAVLPPVLQMRGRDVIYPRRKLPANARFGPVEGTRHAVSLNDASELIINASSHKTPLFLLRDERLHIVNIDVSDKDKSNWIGLLPLGDQTTANVWLYEEHHQLYAITTESIPSRKTLMLGYSKNYAENYGLVGQPTKDIQSEVSNESKLLWCYECQRSMPSASMLQRHLDVYHKDNKPPKRRYQCRLCTRTFSRLFTLRRHRILHCTKKSDNSDNLTSMDMLPEVGLNSVPNTDDNRIPSDESFQNYSNGLDFSTNLFDTDRIPGLDISGNSRSEGEFNPYSIGYKDDNALTNDLEFANPCSTGTEIPQTCFIGNKIRQQNVEPILFTCTYCKQIVVKKKRRQHLRECSARRFECECGKVFTSKKLLAQHIHQHHPFDLKKTSTTDASATPKDATKYKCEKCQHIFKRRGMLVNHLWRVHKTVSASVPLQKRIRHYPCVACPKIYRAAAKRDRHVARHHPGADSQQAQSIEGGVRTCEPAQCPACPRQYCTRAKLLQHQRAHHPYLATPSNRNLLKPKSNNMNNQIAASEELVKFRTSCNQML